MGRYLIGTVYILMIYFLFQYIESLIGTKFPDLMPLLTNNTAATIIFFITDVIMGIPLLLGMIVAGAYGIFSSYSPWYIPIGQVVVLYLVWFIVNLMLIPVFGIGSGVITLSAAAYNKLSWINFSGRIGRKTFFIRNMLANVILAILYFYCENITNTMMFVSLAGFLMLASSYVKRLHDLNKSGYYCIGISIIHMFLKEFNMLQPMFGVCLFLALCYLKGDDIENEYGCPEK